jgi:hypothetical protein
MKEWGKLLIMGGIIAIVVGWLLWRGVHLLRWLGHLPGDIRVERPGFSFYMPLATMIIVSIVLSALWWIVQRFLK